MREYAYLTLQKSIGYTLPSKQSNTGNFFESVHHYLCILRCPLLPILQEHCQFKTSTVALLWSNGRQFQAAWC